MVRALALNVADQGLILGITYDPKQEVLGIILSAEPGVRPEHSGV